MQELIDELLYAAQEIRLLSPRAKQEMESLTSFSADAIAELWTKSADALRARAMTSPVPTSTDLGADRALVASDQAASHLAPTGFDHGERND